MQEEYSQWRCFWCDAVFTDRAKAEIHFGAPHSDKPAPECLAIARREAADWRSKFKTLDSEQKAAFRAVLHHFGPDGANKVAAHVLEERRQRDTSTHLKGSQ